MNLMLENCVKEFFVGGTGTSQGGVKPEIDQSTDENPKPGPEHHAIR